jgi:hypothetical protein
MPTHIEIKGTEGRLFDEALVKESPPEVAKLYNRTVQGGVLKLTFTGRGAGDKLVYLPRDIIHFWKEA